ncbi:MAG: tetratricopeptide repeat protein [Candidatus Omnitrophota bacterium]
MNHSSYRIIHLLILTGLIAVPLSHGGELKSAVIKLKDGRVIDVDVLNKTAELIDVAFPDGKVVRYSLKDIESVSGEEYPRESPEYGRLLKETFNKNQTAVPVLPAEVTADTDDPADAFKKAGEFSQAGELQTAAVYLTVAINGKYRLWDSYYQRANAYYTLQDYARAADDFSQLIKLEPEDYIGYSNRGECFLKLNRPQDALADFNRAIRLNPADEYTYANRGMAYFSLGQTAEALADLAKAIDLAPEGAALNYSNRAVIYLDQKDYARAVEDLTRAIEGMPAVPGFYANRSAAYFYLKEYQKSYDDMVTAEKLGIPRNPQLELNLIKELYKTHLKK